MEDYKLPFFKKRYFLILFVAFGAICVAALFMAGEFYNGKQYEKLALQSAVQIKSAYSAEQLQNESTIKYASDRIIVKFKSNLKPRKEEKISTVVTDSAELNTINSKYGIIAYEKIADVKNSKSKKQNNTYVLRWPIKNNVWKVIEDLKQNPYVEYAEPDFVITTDVIPNDSDFSKLYGLHNTGQTGGTVDADIDAPEAWEASMGNNNVIVAVIDSGIDYTHPDLIDNIWINEDEIPDNLIDDDANGYKDDVYGVNFVADSFFDFTRPLDDRGHGTHVAGIIGASRNNNQGVAGVIDSPNVKLMACKALNSNGAGTVSDAINCIAYAIDNNADIINASWHTTEYSQALKDIIEEANQQGIILVAAAGNSNYNIDYNLLCYPASYNNDNIIAVASSDYNDNKASSSNYGPVSVDLAAPGVQIYSTVPTGNCFRCDPSGYKYLSGTSMATPYVTGAVAFTEVLFPELTHLEVKQRILDRVDRIPLMNGLTLTGGRLNLNNIIREENSVCGDNYCAGYASDEDCNLCSEDCISGQGGSCPTCHKGRCDGYCDVRREDSNCSDCALPSCCGDNKCEGLESVSNCRIDCGCLDNSDCDDFNSCTADICDVSTGVCENAWSSCGLSDACCGPTCSSLVDPDCQVKEDCSTCFKGVCDGLCHPQKEDSTCSDCQ